MVDAFKVRTIKVNGVEVSLDTDVDLGVGDLTGDMDSVAAQMGFWGSVWSAAVQEIGDADAHYRHWRAQKANEVLKADPKLPEWKVRNRIESDPKFLVYKHALAVADNHVTLAKATFMSFDKKSNQLQSKGAMSRSELDATGMSTPATPRPKANRVKKTKKLKTKHQPDDDDPRVSAMKGMFGKKTQAQ